MFRRPSLVSVAIAATFVVPIALADGVLEDLQIRRSKGEAEVVIRGASKIPTYAVRSREQGRLIVVNVEDASLPKGGLKVLGKSSLIASTTASKRAQNVQVAIRTRRPVAYRVRTQPTKIIVRLEPMVGAPDAKEARHRSSAIVRDVVLEKRGGRERVVLELNGPAPFRIQPGSKGPAKLYIPKARIARSAAKALHGTQSSTVRHVTLSSRDLGVEVEVDRASGATGTAIREGNRIVWLFAPGQQEGGRPSTTTLAKEEPIELEAGMEVLAAPEVAGFSSKLPLQVGGRRAQQRYSGRRIDLDLKDADIHDILRLISEVGRVNVVTSDEVKGSVTLRMQNVPWDQALEVILQAKGLGMTRQDNMIRVAPLEQLEKEREAAIARKKQNLELAPLETRLVPVSYATADELKARVGELLSERGTVSTDARTNVLLVRDLAENLDDVEELVRSLDTQTPQVLVEARIVEASSQHSRDLGIQWGGAVTAGQATGNPTGLVFPANVGVTGGNYDANTPTQGLSPIQSQVATPNFAVNLPATTGTGQGGALGITLGSVGSNVNLNVRLSAAEANGVVRIISSPRILTLDNHEAHIAQGTLIPYSQVSAQGVQTAFQEAKLQLSVRPHVTSDGSVGMHVEVTRDEPDFTRTSARGDPTILKREAETDLLVLDAETAVIGGIFTRNTGRTVNQVPFFGDIPIIGVLFQRKLVRDERNELLIFLTPRIVNRSRALRS